jgi:hypothetical protein
MSELEKDKLHTEDRENSGSRRGFKWCVEEDEVELRGKDTLETNGLDVENC